MSSGDINYDKEENKLNIQLETKLSTPDELDKGSLQDESDKIKQSSNWHKSQLTLACFIKFVLMLIASYLCWKCNSGENIFMRVLFTSISAIFSEIYILYYAVYRVYMGNSCNAGTRF